MTAISFVEIQNSFLHLPVKSLFKDQIIFEEGCVTTCIDLIKNGIKIESRLVKPFGLSVQNHENITSNLLFLFNEYRIILESVLIKNSIPYKVKKTIGTDY